MRSKLVIVIFLISTNQLLESCKNNHSSLSKDDHIERLNQGGFIIEGLVDASGRKQGLWKKIDEHGSLISETNYKNNIEEGKSTSYYENGKIYIECFYKAGKLWGEYKMYFINGQLNSVTNRTDKGQTGLFQVFYENGQLSQEGFHDNGKRVGKWSSYHNNGKIRSVQSYLPNGFKNGEWIQFTDKGDTIKWEKYENNRMIYTKNY